MSEVLWTKVLKMGFTLLPGYTGAVSIYLIFAFWATLTLAILVMMEGLSAFLHTLRLHWYKKIEIFGEKVFFKPIIF